MLEAAGRASTSAAAGIIGKERHVTWHDLTAPAFTARWFTKENPKESALERYDFEFAFRLDVLAASRAGEGSSSLSSRRSAAAARGATSACRR